MPNVHADPDKLRQFAKVVGSSADQLQQFARSLSRALENANWDDPEGQRFGQDFKQTLKMLGQIAEKLKRQHAPAVQKKATALEQYRGR